MKFPCWPRKKRNIEETREKEEIVDLEKGTVDKNTAPEDDVCSICYDNFMFPVKTSCGHWYCGDCIWLYWEHRPALNSWKCPMCAQNITRLILDASINITGHIYTLENIRHYLYKRARQWPLILKLSNEVMDPDRMIINETRNMIICFLLCVLGVFFNLFPQGFGYILSFFAIYIIILDAYDEIKWIHERRVKNLIWLDAKLRQLQLQG